MIDFRTHYCRQSASRLIAPMLVFIAVLCASLAANADTSPLIADSRKGEKTQETPSLDAASTPQVAPPLRPARALALVTPKVEMWPDEIEAHGDIMPWQETRVGTEIGGLRLISVLVNVGDVVKKGQVLARLNPSTMEAELEAANARLMEAQALLVQALATLDRAKRLEPSGGVSQQDLTLYQTQQQTAAARVNAARAQVKTQQLRLDSTTLVAPDDGVVSSRSMTEGAIVQAGNELFRLIRQGRLEWRFEVKGETLLRLSPGQEVTVRSPLGPEIKGRVRQVSPTIDMTTRKGLVYVDLPADTNLKAGLTVSGKLGMGKRKAMVLPSSAVLHESSASRVFKIGADNKVQAVEVQVGRISDDQVEIVSGLDARTKVVAKIAELMKTGDLANVPDEQEARGLARAAPEPKRAAE